MRNAPELVRAYTVIPTDEFTVLQLKSSCITQSSEKLLQTYFLSDPAQHGHKNETLRREASARCWCLSHCGKIGQHEFCVDTVFLLSDDCYVWTQAHVKKKRLTMKGECRWDLREIVLEVWAWNCWWQLSWVNLHCTVLKGPTRITDTFLSSPVVLPQPALAERPSMGLGARHA